MQTQAGQKTRPQPHGNPRRQLGMQPSSGDVMERIGAAGELAEQGLIERARQGDHDAFSDLVTRRIPPAFRTASAILGNEADAYDVVQDAITSAWVNLPRLRDANRFDAWLNRILLNRCRDVLRRRRRRGEMTLDDVVLPGQPDPDLDLTDLNTAFEQLHLEERHLLVLHHLHHQPVAEMARKLGWPVGTVKWRLYRARRALEKALEAQR